ncbi:MAG: sulfatase-like hydrolase/transferase [Proteobacteria bacterium]|jgi:phosphoglycerol transferase MdoB-like AlkP superfamily enzyme|nr:sulfatase-like hydrolase/transferase [Pseudomonadota bacterium]
MPERPFQNPYLNLLLRFSVLLAILFGYSLIMETYGGFSTKGIYLQWLEIGLVLYLYGMFYFILKPVPWRGLLAAVPLILIYLVHDIFYLAYGKVFRFINIVEFPELVQILSPGYLLLLLMIFLLPALAILGWVNYRRPRRLLGWVLPLLLLVVSVEVSPNTFTTGFREVAHEIVKYSDSKSVENNGRLAMLLYREAERASILERIVPYRNRVEFDREAAKRLVSFDNHNNHHNVHLIILESFLDPRLFHKLGFSQPPVHPDFARLVGENASLSISPVFGGATAQAEFEVLCGLPAFERLSSVEFNVFTGSAAHCLPGLLADAGYRSVASNAYKPNFFNTVPAYQGMGFSESYFPVEFLTNQNSYLHFGKPGTEEYLFDAQLFAQNRDFVRRHLQQQPDKPLFNYLLTIYGHTPHVLDPQRRPARITLRSTYDDDHLLRAANQFYYRSQAIAEHVNALIKMDPHSLIIFMSDHVPPLRNGPNTYRALRYMDNIEHSYFYNPIVIIENGKVRKYSTLHHYDVSGVILNYLSDGEYCKHQYCGHLSDQPKSREALLPDYLRLMAHASE